MSNIGDASGLGPSRPPRKTPENRAKRSLVAAACLSCRRSKLKCDGQRPCSQCLRKNVDCKFSTRNNETERQAQRRLQEENTEAARTLTTVFARIHEAEDEETALAIYKGIRAGQSPRRIMQALNSPLSDEAMYNSQLCSSQTSFLMCLAQSTVSLQSISIHVAQIFGTSSSFELPQRVMYRMLKDKLVTRHRLEELVDVVNGRRTRRESPIDAMYSGPPVWVPAAPWTRLLDEDHDISHLVSIFFAFVNPYWWYVEENTFIQDMRSKNLNSTYCSSFLVNSILSLTAMFSEESSAYAEPYQPLTRGEHFYREALRLWQREHGRPSITNVQGLLVLCMSAALRGKDAPGLSLLELAIELNDKLPPIRSQSTSETTETRVRRSLKLSLTCIEVSWFAFCFRPCRTSKEKLISLEGIFASYADTVAYWQPYPLDQQSLPYKWSSMQRYRYELTCFVHEAVTMTTDEGSSSDADIIVSAGSGIIVRLDDWYRSLPLHMRYTKRMPAAMYEFHAHCASIHMHTLDLLRKKLVATPDIARRELKLEELRNKAQRHATKYAIFAGNLVEDYREMYGVKIVLPHIFNVSALASFRLLEHLKTTHMTSPVAEGHRTGPSDSDVAADGARLFRTFCDAQSQDADIPSTPAPVEETAIVDKADILQALEECFRFLLGAGFSQLLPRGIAQSVFVTALDVPIDLPASFLRIVSLLVGDTWDPGHLNHFDSSIPNYAFDLDLNGIIGEMSMVSLAKRFVTRLGRSEAVPIA